mmetsp:Transcript_65679/g.172102  ORF Transcript_65679/g.172102 Transcript_65679/m.172102 type:complete len:228 (-) Transcript_65679:482-1165(-)
MDCAAISAYQERRARLRSFLRRLGKRGAPGLSGRPRPSLPAFWPRRPSLRSTAKTEEQVRARMSCDLPSAEALLWAVGRGPALHCGPGQPLLTAPRAGPGQPRRWPPGGSWTPGSTGSPPGSPGSPSTPCRRRPGAWSGSRPSSCPCRTSSPPRRPARGRPSSPSPACKAAPGAPGGSSSSGPPSPAPTPSPGGGSARGGAPRRTPRGPRRRGPWPGGGGTRSCCRA